MIRSPAPRPPAPDWATADRDLRAPAIAAQPGLWQPLPGWARRHGDDAGPSWEAAFAAGAALLALDQIVRPPPPTQGRPAAAPPGSAPPAGAGPRPRRPSRPASPPSPPMRQPCATPTI